MDPLTHIVLGAAVAIAGTRLRTSRRAAALAGVAGGLLPDADVVLRSASDPLFAVEYHRHFTHSLAFLPVIATLGAVIAMWLLRAFKRPAEWRQLWSPALLGGLSHVICDAWTSYGTRLWWPFDQTRVSLDWISVIDPLFTVPLAACIALAVRYASRQAAVVGLCWVVVYLTFCVVQRQRAVGELDRWLATAPIRNVSRRELKPSFGNVLVWRVLLQSEGKCYTMAVRCPIGQPPVVLPGSSGKLFSSPEEAIGSFSIPPDSTQAEDVRRFFRFSDHWVGLHPADSMVLGDLRYASVPTDIYPLWGIIMDPAQASRHVSWRTFRGDMTPSLSRLFRQMKGTTTHAPVP